ALFYKTTKVNPTLTLSYHSQGEVIYWKFLNLEPPRAEQIAMRFGGASGYLVESTPYSSGFAGFKDWFIQDFFKPGYTIEVGRGVNPLPLSQFDKIYRDNLGILTLGMTVSA
ncbi:gamma-D-glutamyl-meso-diaminopimelate peptidase, partial [Clostridiaceae bacterium OttesenSCG-928-D20]|nr:gamma-D-glutamyl-meso-diaminopimelate peptidase [Clostridiaceae bacterium OttesenSCG-928-D20]